MKPPIGRIFVFLLADRTHDERQHGRLMAVIRNIFDNGKPRTTQGAVDKRISVSEIFRGEEFGKALITGGYVRRDEDKFLLGFFTFSNFKSGVA